MSKGLIEELESNIKKLIELERELGGLLREQIFISNINDKLNYDYTKSLNIKIRINKLQDESSELKNRLGII